MRKIIPLFLTTLSLQAYTPFKTVESPFSILKKNTQEKTQLSASTQSNPKAIPAIAITTWTNQAGDDLWQSSLNWDNGVPSDSSYQANFDVAQATSIDFGNASCGSLQFTNKAQQNSFTNGTLTLSGINSSLIEVINEYQKITSDVICLSDGTISIQEGAALAFDIGTPSGNLAGNNTNLTIVGPGLFRNASLIGSIGGSVFNNINIIMLTTKPSIEIIGLGNIIV